MLTVVEADGTAVSDTSAVHRVPIHNGQRVNTSVSLYVSTECLMSSLRSHSTQRKQYNVWDLNYEPFLTLVTCYSVIDTNVGSAGECVNFLLLSEQCPFNRQSTAPIGLEL